MKDLKKFLLLPLALGLLSGCTFGNQQSSSSDKGSSGSTSESSSEGKKSSSGSESQSGSEESSGGQSSEESSGGESSSEESSGGESSSESSSEEELTLESALAEIILASSNKRILSENAYINIYYLGETAIVNEYVERDSTSMCAVLDQGTAYFDLGEDGFELSEWNSAKQRDLYNDMFYTPFDILYTGGISNFVLTEETDDAFLATLTLDNLNKPALAVLSGYQTQAAASVKEATVSVAKDLSEINFSFKVGSYSETVTLSEFGTAEHEEAESFLESLDEPFEAPEAWGEGIEDFADEALGLALADFPFPEGLSYCVTQYYSGNDALIYLADFVAPDVQVADNYYELLKTKNWYVGEASALNTEEKGEDSDTELLYLEHDTGDEGVVVICQIEYYDAADLEDQGLSKYSEEGFLRIEFFNYTYPKQAEGIDAINEAIGNAAAIGYDEEAEEDIYLPYLAKDEGIISAKLNDYTATAEEQMGLDFYFYFIIDLEFATELEAQTYGDAYVLELLDTGVLLLDLEDEEAPIGLADNDNSLELMDENYSLFSYVNVKQDEETEHFILSFEILYIDWGE